MPVRILTVPFDPAAETFQDETLNAFLLNKKVTILQCAFFQQDGRAYWTVLVAYDAALSPPPPKETSDLSPTRQLLYERLREWRKETAETQGVPVFLIATNAQLKAVARQMPQGLEALRKIHGFGKKKAETHGEHIVDIIKAFQENHPEKTAPAPADGGGETETPPWQEDPKE